MTNKTACIICVFDAKTHMIAQVGLYDGVLVYIAGSHGLKNRTEFCIKDIEEKGAYLRRESRSGYSINVDLEKIESNDMRYLEAVVREFRARGLWARVYPQSQAEIWQYLHTLQVDEDIKYQLLQKLPMLTDKEGEDILKIFQDAKKELEEIEARRVSGIGRLHVQEQEAENEILGLSA